MANGSKPESSRLNLFYILQVLSDYTDEDHPMSASEIRDKVNAEFGYLSSTGAVISLDTVTRTLDDLTDRIFPPGMDYREALFRYGYCIFCLMKKDGGYRTYHAAEDSQAPKKYYYYEYSLGTAELLTLKDAIETYSYFSEEDITDIVRKLVRLRPRSFPDSRYFDVAGEVRDEDSLLLMNIEALNRIINNRNGAKITYCFYNTDKKLTPRPGYPKIIDPVHLMWSNGYYYLLAYNKKYENITSMRIDRITDIEEIQTENTYRAENFNPVQYRYEHPVMFGGKKETIVMLCRDTGKNYIMNTLVDVFGKNVRVTQASEELLEKYLKHRWENDREHGIIWLRVSIESALGGVELWATQYCNDCLIISPEESRDRVKKRLEEGIAYYQSNDGHC